jgi:twitching motility two-component system response regulator PilG
MKRRILVVEDDESLLKLETILLRVQGYDVTGVVNGRAALQEMECQRFNLVLLDVMLPDMGGFEVCRCIRENPVTALVPVIMLTARKSRGDLVAGRQAGADAFITKPFKTAEVIGAIRRLIG